MKMKYVMATAGIMLIGALGLMKPSEHSASGGPQQASKRTKRPRNHSTSDRRATPAEEFVSQESHTTSQPSVVPQWRPGVLAPSFENTGKMAGEVDYSRITTQAEVLNDSRAVDQQPFPEVRSEPCSLGLPLESRSVQMPLSYVLTSDEISKIAPEVPSAVTDQVRDEFDQEAGVTEFAPDSPEYRRRWISAQEAEADKLRARYGWGPYAAMQREAVLKALAENPASKR